MSWWSRDMLDHKLAKLDLEALDATRFRALCERFLDAHDMDYLQDMCFWAASFLGTACDELSIPLKVSIGQYNPEGCGFDHAWLVDSSGTPFDITAVAHAAHRRETRSGDMTGAAMVCPACGEVEMDCGCDDPPDPVERVKQFSDADEMMDAGYECVERNQYPEWKAEFVEPGRYSGESGDAATARASELGFDDEEEASAREMARSVLSAERAAHCAARPALDHGRTFSNWQTKARRAIQKAFSGVGEDDESDWLAIAKSALAETLPQTMYRGFSVSALNAAEAERMALTTVRNTRHEVPYSFSKAVARSFAVGVEPLWAAADATSEEGRKHQGKAGQWGVIVSVAVTPDMVDWGCIDTGNAMFGGSVYDHLPFDAPVGEALAEILVEGGGTHNAEWDLEVKPYHQGLADIEVFQIAAGDTGEMEAMWRQREAERKAEWDAGQDGGRRGAARRAARIGKTKETLKPYKYAVDNPGGDWLKGQRERAAKSNSSLGTVTAYAEELPVLVDKLDGVEGRNGEQARFGEGPSNAEYNRDRDRIEHLKNSIEKHGFHKDNGILIWVGYDGTPLIAEGNHRLQAVRELNIKYIPTQIRWFAGSERKEYGGEFSAETLAANIPENDPMQSPDDFKNEIEEIAVDVRHRLGVDHELEEGEPPKALCLDFARGLVDELARRGYSAGVTQGTFEVDWPDEETYDEWDEDDFEAIEAEEEDSMSAEEVMGQAMHFPLHYWVRVTTKDGEPIGPVYADITADQFDDECKGSFDPVWVWTGETERHQAQRNDFGGRTAYHHVMRMFSHLRRRGC